MTKDVLEAIRQQLIAELEDLYTDPSYGAWNGELRDYTEFVRYSDARLRATRILTDKVARICQDHRLWTLEELDEVYDDLLDGWEKFVHRETPTKETET